MPLSTDTGRVYTSTLVRTRDQYLRMKEALGGVTSPKRTAMLHNIDEALHELEEELNRRGADPGWSK